MNEDAVFHRTTLLLGDDAVKKLQSANVLVLGVGGVGGHAAEQLCRAGIGSMTLLDGDKVDPTNLNRQIAALHTNTGRFKAEVLAERFRDINPCGKFTPEVRFLKVGESVELLSRNFDLVIDAIDDVPAKVDFLKNAVELHIPVVSSMGAGGKVDISKISCADISKTFGDPLARKVRCELRNLGIKHGIKCVFSPEERQRIADSRTIGTISYLPAAFGCFAAAAALELLLPQFFEK